MDRDTMRMILLVIGVLVIAGIYVWGRNKQKLLDFLHRRGEFDELEFDRSADSESPAYDPAYDEEKEFESASTVHRKEPHSPEEASGYVVEFLDEPASATHATHAKSARPTALGSPFLIQLSLVAGGDRYFRGDELRDALTDLDLIHGEMGIFHRYDRAFREPLFSVASLVEPGTFPMHDLESFECPGIVLFFQPAKVPDPLAVFDDLVDTCHELADRLDGIEWDETRQPLTNEKIARMRALLEEAYD